MHHICEQKLEILMTESGGGVQKVPKLCGLRIWNPPKAKGDYLCPLVPRDVRRGRRVQVDFARQAERAPGLHEDRRLAQQLGSRG